MYRKIEYGVYFICALNTSLFGFATMIRCLFADYTIGNKIFYSAMMFLIGIIGVNLLRFTLKEYKEHD